MKQNTTVMVFLNQLEAIRKQPRKVQKDLMAAMLCFLAFGEQPDFNGMTLRNKQLAESVWMLMLPVLERSRRLRCTDRPSAAELEQATSRDRACPVRPERSCAHAHVRAEEEKEIEVEEEIEVEKESEERKILSFADAYASVSSAPADDAPADIPPGKKNDKNYTTCTPSIITIATPTDISSLTPPAIPPAPPMWPTAIVSWLGCNTRSQTQKVLRTSYSSTLS